MRPVLCVAVALMFALQAEASDPNVQLSIKAEALFGLPSQPEVKKTVRAEQLFGESTKAIDIVGDTYKRKVTGCLNGAVCNWDEAARLATAERKDLVVLVGQTASAMEVEKLHAQRAIVCIASRDDGFPNPGIYRYFWTSAGLKLAGPSRTRSP